VTHSKKFSVTVAYVLVSLRLKRRPRVDQVTRSSLICRHHRRQLRLRAATTAARLLSAQDHSVRIFHKTHTRARFLSDWSILPELGRVYIDTSMSCESEFYMYELLVRVLFTLLIYENENLLSDYILYPTKTSLTDCHAASHKLRFL